MGNGELVDILQLVAETDAPGDGRDLDPGVMPQAAHQVEKRGFSLDRSGNGQNHLLDFPLRDTVAQEVDFEVGGRDALHGRNDAAQHMVQTFVLVGVLDGEHVGDLLHNADRRTVALAVGADGAHLLVGEIVATAAIPDLAPETVDAAGHVAHRFGLHAQDMDGQPQRGAPPHSGQFRQLADHVLQELRHIRRPRFYGFPTTLSSRRR